MRNLFFAILFGFGSLGGSTAFAAQTVCPVMEQTVFYNPDMFYADIVAVEDGANLMQLIDGKKDYVNYGSALLSAAIAGTVERFVGNGTLTVHLHNIDFSRLPDHVFYLQGRRVCAGEAEVRRIDAHAVDINIPLRGDRLGQASVVLPIAALGASSAPALCISADFPLAYLPAINAGTYKGEKNTLCGMPGATPHTTLLGESIKAGKRELKYLLIHGRDS